MKDYVSKYIKDNKPELEEEKLEEYNLLNTTDIFKENGNQVYIGWNDLKWYEGSYVDVDAIMSGLNHLADDDYSYRYARLGEDYSDYEENYNDSADRTDEELEYIYLTRYFDDEVI